MKYTQEELTTILKLHKLWLVDTNRGVRADLQNADLQVTNLRGANLRGANLRGASLWRADLQNADLWRAELQNADLWRADLQGANLRGASLQGANLRGANLENAQIELTQHSPIGGFTAWKKLHDGVIAELIVPADAARCNSTSRKCRAEYVKVVAMYDRHGTKLTDDYVGHNKLRTILEYRVGQVVKANNYDGDLRESCTGGIHYFITRKEAEAYEFN